jgi:D-lactate dehydrogenase (cytochrome)
VNRAIARAPRAATIEFETDPDLLARYLEDAAHYPGGHAQAVARPRDVDEVAAVVKRASHVLPVGAQSSLTGGATPSGDVVLSTERLTAIRMAGDRVTTGAGVTLRALQDALALHQTWLPPVPTYLGATVGGAVSTNAAGAATFKYGTMRDWVDALTIVLPSGDVLSIERGEVVAASGGAFVICDSHGEHRIDIPRITMPDVPKRSAGYHAAPGMDLVDFFIGAEGTLGIVVDARLRVQSRPAGVCWVLAPVDTEQGAIALAGELRQAAQQTWQTGDKNGIDVAAIEHIDRRSLQVLREDGVNRRLGITLPENADVLLLAQIELDEEAMTRDLWNDLANARGESRADTPLTRFCTLLDRYGALDTAEISLPGDDRRAQAFVELRESVPAGVNRRVAHAHARDDRVHKTAADIIVPYEQFGMMMRECRRLCEEANLDLAVWGHISDGNVHPNVIPHGYDDVVRGRDVLIALARQVIAMGGCPLAEHGVGRHPVKQEMLRMMYGTPGVDAMRRVKASLDPQGKLAAGVLFQQC